MQQEKRDNPSVSIEDALQVLGKNNSLVSIEKVRQFLTKNGMGHLTMLN